MMPRWVNALVRHPITHFMVSGIVLVALYRLLHREPAPNLVVITSDQIRALAHGTSDRAGLHARVDKLVEQELLVREARRLGLDAQDEVVRDRLAHKMAFLLTSQPRTSEPTNEQLQSWMNSHASEYQSPARVDLVHVYFRNDTDAGISAVMRAQQALEALNKGATPSTVGDPFLLGHEILDRTQETLTSEYGDAFASTAFRAPLQAWQGPITTRFGVHLLRVTRREAQGMLPLEVARPRARSEYLSSQQANTLRQSIESLRARYGVRVEWPAELQ